MKYKLEPSDALLVRGPANMKVVEGAVKILGAVYKTGEKLVFHRFRSYTITGVEPSLIEILGGEGYSVEEVVEPADAVWEKNIDKLLKHEKPLIALIVGPVESGKTTFVAMASNKAIAMGFKTGVIDGDVGQADIGPPGFVSLAYPSKRVLWLRELEASELRFVGDITPSHAPENVVLAVKELVENAVKHGCQAVFIDTDGWVTGRGAVEYKLKLIRHVNPTHIVFMDEENELFKELMRTGYPVYKLPPPPSTARVRGRDGRTALRSDGYRRFLGSRRKIKLNLDEIVVIGSCLLSPYTIVGKEAEELGRRLGLKVKAYRQVDSVLHVYLDQYRIPPNPVGHNIVIHVKDEEKGVLAALLDKKLKELAPALIESWIPEAKTVIVGTSYEGNASNIGGLMLGRIELDENLREKRRAHTCLI